MASEVDTSHAEELATLRELLLAPDRATVRQIHQRLDNPVVRATDVAEVLAEAVGLSAARGRRLSLALTPSVEDALRASIQKDPQALGQAIYPILGPAIRKAIAAALSGMIQSLNETLDRSLSIEGLRWRLEAARTGKPFAEVVLLHTLVYRVEQVLLIHQQTGLLLHHVIAPMVHPPDADLVSGMLTALRDFVHDSFSVEPTAALDTMRVGDLTLWVEPGPYAYLAAVVRGSAPASLRQTLQEVLEDIHRAHASALERFSGDSQSFDVLRPDLERCVLSQHMMPQRSPKRRAWLVGGCVALLAAAAAGVVIRDQLQWSAYLQRLRTEPGIVVVNESRGLRRFTIDGLRDPLAADPDLLLGGTGLSPARIDRRWESYQAGVPAFTLQRAKRLLRPPAGVQLRVENHVLKAAGHAPHAWVANAQQLSTLVPGVVRYDDEALVDDSQAEIGRATTELEHVTIRFDPGSSLIRANDARALPAVADLIQRIVAEADPSGRFARVDVIGHTDATGLPASNDRLAAERTERVAAALGRLHVPSQAITSISVPRDRAVAPAVDPDWRSVTFRVRRPPDEGAKGRQ